VTVLSVLMGEPWTALFSPNLRSDRVSFWNSL
jgi:hypothetical protein